MSNENSQNQVLGSVNGRALRVVRSGGGGGSDISITSSDSSIDVEKRGSNFDLKAVRDYMTVHMTSIPGVGQQSDKSYSEILSSINSGKSVIVIGVNKDELILYKVDTNNGYIDFIRPGVSEIDGTGVGSLPDAMTGGIRISSDNSITEFKKYTVGKRYWNSVPITIDPFYLHSCTIANSSSTTFILENTNYSTEMKLTVVEPYPNGSANADLLMEIQSGGLTDIKVNFMNYEMPYGQEHELVAPANLSSVLANGSGKYGIRVTGEFWTIDWLGGNT